MRQVNFGIGFLFFIFALVSGCGGLQPKAAVPQKPPVLSSQIFGNHPKQAISGIEQSVKMETTDSYKEGNKEVAPTLDNVLTYYGWNIQCRFPFPEMYENSCVVPYSQAVYLAEVYLGPEELTKAANLLYGEVMKMPPFGKPDDFLAARVAKLFGLGEDKVQAAAKRDIAWLIDQHDTRGALIELKRWGVPQDQVSDNARRHIAWLANGQRNPSAAMAEINLWGLGQAERDLVCVEAKSQKGTYLNSWHRDPILLEHCGGDVTPVEANGYLLQGVAKEYLSLQDFTFLLGLSSSNLARFARAEVSYCDFSEGPLLQEFADCSRQYRVATAVQYNSHTRAQFAAQAFLYGLTYMKLSLQEKRPFHEVNVEARLTGALAHKELGKKELGVFTPVYWDVNQLLRR